MLQHAAHRRQRQVFFWVGHSYLSGLGGVLGLVVRAHHVHQIPTIGCESLDAISAFHEKTIHTNTRYRTLTPIRLGAGRSVEDAAEILRTSRDRDGTKAGFDMALTRAVSDAVPVPVISTGGMGNLDHLADGIQQGGADAVLATSIFHYREYTVGQAKVRMRERGIAVRVCGWGRRDAA